jgi:uncharacterized membrane protein
MHHTTSSPAEPRRSLAATALIGIGIMAAVDQIIFHQILAWHHFYDWSTPAVGLMSDGFLHAAELLAIVAGFFLIADLRRRQALAPVWAWAGFFLGAGGFQLFDGIINHKVLRLHQIRYGVYLLPYDIAWNAFALALICMGLLLLNRARSSLERSPGAASR